MTEIFYNYRKVAKNVPFLTGFTQLPQNYVNNNWFAEI